MVEVTHCTPLPGLKATVCSKGSEFQPVIKQPGKMVNMPAPC